MGPSVHRLSTKEMCDEESHLKIHVSLDGRTRPFPAGAVSLTYERI